MKPKLHHDMEAGLKWKPKTLTRIGWISQWDINQNRRQLPLLNQIAIILSEFVNVKRQEQLYFIKTLCTKEGLIKGRSQRHFVRFSTCYFWVIREVLLLQPQQPWCLIRCTESTIDTRCSTPNTADPYKQKKNPQNETKVNKKYQRGIQEGFTHQNPRGMSFGADVSC